jgi:hypothetical protein
MIVQVEGGPDGRNELLAGILFHNIGLNGGDHGQLPGPVLMKPFSAAWSESRSAV